MYISNTIFVKALEAVVLRCPSEISPFLTQIVSVGITMIKYDPVWPHRQLPICLVKLVFQNYAGGEDDEDTEMDDNEEDNEFDADDEYV